MEKVTYTPSEFAEVFGKERTWGYRQLYAGKVKAITELGRTMIPKSEVDRLLGEASRYLGAQSKPKKTDAKQVKAADKRASGTRKWVDVIRDRKGLQVEGKEEVKVQSPASARKKVFNRLTR